MTYQGLKNKLIIILLVMASLPLAISCAGDGSDSAEVKKPDIPHIYGFEPDTLACIQKKVKKNEFFSPLLMNLGFTAQEAYNITQACDSVFDVKTLRVGNEYEAYYEVEDSVLAVLNDTLLNNVYKPAKGEKPRYVVYVKDKVRCVVFDCKPPYSVTQVERPVTVERRFADVTIDNSLWVDMRDAGVSPLLIVELSDIYAWTIDFFALQKGDNFKVIYDEKLCDGEVVSVDTVRYAVFSHGDDVFPAVMFNQNDGGNIYWNEKGESMRKAFLKAPLKFSRISSGFSYARRHPITRRVQPHTGVDYAAPKGTPVMTIGDGVVTSVKYEGAGGNTVRIRHNSVYSTAYLHLSKFGKGIKAGKRVHQGDIIGYVGSTGRSTGPHLDFRVWKNGTPINPLRMQSPPAEPLKQELADTFNVQIQKYSQLMDYYIRSQSSVADVQDTTRTEM